MRDRSRQQRNEAHGKTKRSVNSSKRCVIDGFAIVIVLPIVLPTTESPNRSLNCRSDRAWKRGSESKINCTIHRVLQRHGWPSWLVMALSRHDETLSPPRPRPCGRAERTRQQVQNPKLCTRNKCHFALFVIASECTISRKFTRLYRSRQFSYHPPPTPLVTC